MQFALMEKKKETAGSTKKKIEKEVPKVATSAKFIMADKKEAEKQAAKK